MIWETYEGKVRPLSVKRFLINYDSPSLSLFQSSVKKFFQPFWSEDVVCEEVILPDTKLRVDIMNFTKKVAIEVNGLFHVQYSPHFQKTEEDFEKQVFRDVYKEHLLQKNGFEVLEIYEKNMPLTPEWITKTFGEGILD